jgi:ABC-type transport system involved in multi-copper enzyme maturation permease subunit
MINLIRAEARKLLTVRSTYLLVGGALLIVLFYAGYVTGYKITPEQLHTPMYLMQQSLNAVSAVTGLAAIVILLLLAHEYRHNTIVYTLTLARSRSRVLLAKILVAIKFMALFGLLVAVLSPLVTVLGAHLHGYTLVPQTFFYWNVLWRVLFYTCGYGLFALLLVALIRNQIGAIVVLLFAPITIEGILSLLLKENTKYLPFTSLGNVVAIPTMHGGTPGKSAITFLVYLVVGWLIAWYLFLRRDAN